MSLFSQPKPRKFQHRFMYVDERKDRLRAIERRAREELGMEGEPGSFDAERLRGAFLGATRHAGRRGGWASSGRFLGIGAILMLLLFLFCAWRMLLSL